jgi:hypothetical protein
MYKPLALFATLFILRGVLPLGHQVPLLLGIGIGISWTAWVSGTLK